MLSFPPEGVLKKIGCKDPGHKIPPSKQFDKGCVLLVEEHSKHFARPWFFFLLHNQRDETLDLPNNSQT
jgi:hypothetical protein